MRRIVFPPAQITLVAAHPAFGNLDAIGRVCFLSGHAERHTLQIEEVKAAPGFPAGWPWILQRGA